MSHVYLWAPTDVQWLVHFIGLISKAAAVTTSVCLRAETWRALNKHCGMNLLNNFPSESIGASRSQDSAWVKAHPGHKLRNGRVAEDLFKFTKGWEGLVLLLLSCHDFAPNSWFLFTPAATPHVFSACFIVLAVGTLQEGPKLPLKMLSFFIFLLWLWPQDLGVS